MISMIKNSLILIRGNDFQLRRHGGPREYRQFAMYLNGVFLHRFADDEAPNYNSGKYLDRAIDDFAAPIEKALDIKMMRGELKDRIKLIP